MITTGNHFLAKYIAAEYIDSDCRMGVVTDGFCPDTMVHVAGCGVDDSILEQIDAPQKVIIVPRETDDTRDYRAMLRDNGSIVSVLYPSLVVGTGMDGFLRKIVNGIARGTYFHIAGNDARFSVVHALDVARLVSLVAPKGGCYRFSDGVDPSIHDLGEALSVRVNHKRITTLSASWARRAAYFSWLTGGPDAGMIEKLTRGDIVAASQEMAEVKGFEPRNVVEYLSTHQYDENDI